MANATESETKLATPLGDCEIQVGSRTRLAVRFSALVVNGVTYAGSLRLINYVGGDGSFVPGDDALLRPDRTTTYHALSMHRQDSFNSEPTPAARKRVLAVLPPLVTQWAAGHQYQLQRAEVEQLQDNVERIGDRIAQLRQELTEQEDAHVKAINRLAAAKGKH
jgi:hypothetical protein